MWVVVAGDEHRGGVAASGRNQSIVRVRVRVRRDRDREGEKGKPGQRPGWRGSCVSSDQAGEHGNDPAGGALKQLTFLGGDQAHTL